MDVLGKSLVVLWQEWPGIVGLLGFFCVGGASVFFGLKALFREQLSFGETLALGAGGAPLPLLMGVLLTSLLRMVWKINTNFTWVWLLLAVMAGLAAYRGAGRISWQLKVPQAASVGLGLILIVSFILRLAFIQGLQAPLYFDSAMHYSVIADLLKNFEGFRLPDFQAFVGGYYHLGFHALAGALSYTLEIPVREVMLLYGPIILTLLPMPLFFIVRRETGLASAGLFATLLAGWAWYMPAHMLDWGKYPAITSILSIEFCICCLVLLREASRHQRWIVVCAGIAAALMSTMIHSRSLVVIGLALGSGLIAHYWKKLSGQTLQHNWRPWLAYKLLAALAAAGLLGIYWLIQSRSVLRLAIDPYIGIQGWITLIILVLAPLAFHGFPRATFACLVFMLLLGASLFISVTAFLPVYDAQTLLDRPYVEGILFFPLAVLGGLGYAGMLKALRNNTTWNSTRKKQLEIIIAVCFFGIIIMQFTRYNFSHSNCCVLYSEQDAAAFEWLDRNTPADANILIASFESVVFESNQPAGYSGADAGIWIPVFIHRIVTLEPYYKDFNALETLDEICKLGVTYIYAGSTNQSFNKDQPGNQPEWYARQLKLPGVEIYKLTGCQH